MDVCDGDGDGPFDSASSMARRTWLFTPDGTGCFLCAFVALLEVLVYSYFVYFFSFFLAVFYQVSILTSLLTLSSRLDGS